MADEVDPRILREQLKVLDSLERALKQVKDKKLEGKKQRCLSYVRTAKKDTIDELKAPGSK
jgi:molecular chaperone GrpE (heat shock protein)